MGSRSAVFRGIRDQAEQFLWDQGPHFVMPLERVRHLGTKIGSMRKKITRYDPALSDYFLCQLRCDLCL